MKTKLIIHQPKIKNCNNSFFYEDLIAETDKAQMIAEGEIRVWSFKDKFYTENRNDLIDEYPNDKKLLKAEERAKKEYIEFFGMNNWFMVLGKKDSSEYICSSYKEALKFLKQN